MIRRWLSTSLILSAILTICVAGLWARSYWRVDALQYRFRAGPERLTYSTILGSGRILLARHRDTQPPGWSWSSNPMPDKVPNVGGFLGFSKGPTLNGYGFTIPIWLPFVLVGLPIWAVIRLNGPAKARRRRDAGLCINCAYDLRGSPEWCPECGRMPV
ncbi:MAG TPA: hypothetical protein VF595_12620 [Tepidisphaeraceae bacterium]|jgi:hypothetical protein